MKKIYLFGFLLISSVIIGFSEENAFFVPPKKWRLVDPQTYKGQIKIAYMKKGKSSFAISVNLAEEKTELTMDEYVEVVKKLWQDEPNAAFRDLGAFSCGSGIGRLVEADSFTKSGAARLLQFFFLKDHIVYVLTAGSLKEEFIDHLNDFKQAFQSFRVIEDLLEPLSNLEQKQRIEKEKEKAILAWQKKSSSLKSQDSQREKVLTSFEKALEMSCPEMGAYWRLLMLKDLRGNLR